MNRRSSEFIKELRDTILKQIERIKKIDTSKGEVVEKIIINEVPFFIMKNSGYMWTLQSERKNKDGSIQRTGFSWDLYENEEKFVENRLKPGLYNWLERTIFF